MEEWKSCGIIGKPRWFFLQNKRDVLKFYSGNKGVYLSILLRVIPTFLFKSVNVDIAKGVKDDVALNNLRIKALQLGLKGKDSTNLLFTLNELDEGVYVKWSNTLHNERILKEVLYSKKFAELFKDVLSVPSTSKTENALFVTEIPNMRPLKKVEQGTLLRNIYNRLIAVPASVKSFSDIFDIDNIDYILSILKDNLYKENLDDYNRLTRRINLLKSGFYKVSISHGDFTPWNIGATADKRIVVYDFEMYSSFRVIMFDLVHFIVQRHLVSENRDFQAVLNILDQSDIFQAVMRYEKYALDLYCLDRIINFAESYIYSDNLHWQGTKQLNFWLWILQERK